MVAFVEKLPGMTPAQYKAIVAKAPADEDMDMSEGGHSHGQAAAKGHAHSATTSEDPLSQDGLKPKAVLRAEAPGSTRVFASHGSRA
ncbi:MAG: hypothetical protein ABIY40_07975 [Rhodanobacteraceae bacterium]